MKANNYSKYPSQSIMANPLVEVRKELQGTETVYAIKIHRFDQAVYLKPETARSVIEALETLMKNKALEYRKKKHECVLAVFVAITRAAFCCKKTSLFRIILNNIRIFAYP